MAGGPLRADIDAFVEELLHGFDPQPARAPKVFHDPVWGTHRFWPHEVALIDSPLVQRLRQIYQTGFSYLTYASTTQTRFEHSVGSAIVGKRMLEAIAYRHPHQVDLDPLVGDLATIRAAAILHDVGHGFASHASEMLYRWHPHIAAARQETSGLAEAKASEVLSWYIITSVAFRQLLDKVNNTWGTKLNADTLAGLVLGESPDARTFLGEIINGPFDVDRIDYTVRDADYSGIKAGIDLERFFHDVDVALLQDGRLHLVLRSTHAIEQLLFTKVHLFVRLYRHQKVLAADAAVQNVVATTQALNVKFIGVDFTRVSDYLRVSDFAILTAEASGYPDPLRSLLLQLRWRKLPKRCMALTHRMLKDAKIEQVNIHKVMRLNEDPEGIRTFRDRIWEAIPDAKRPDRLTILPVFPAPPPLREASLVYILSRGETEARTLNSIFRIDEWLSTYVESHWVGYVFGNTPHLEAIGDAAVEILASEGIKIEAKAAKGILVEVQPTLAPTVAREPVALR